jgi:hypothetical protein
MDDTISRLEHTGNALKQARWIRHQALTESI